MSDHLKQHLDTFHQGEKDQQKLRESAVILQQDIEKLKTVRHRDDLRTLRASVEKMLKESMLEDATRQALDGLNKTLEEHAIEAPLMPVDLGKKAADKMPADMLKSPVEHAVNGFNETVQTAYERGKQVWNQSGWGKAAIIGGGLLAGYAILKWLGGKLWGAAEAGANKVADGGSWLWNHKWKILTLGLAGGGAYWWWNNKAEAGTSKGPETKLSGTDVLGKEQKITVDGKERSLKMDAHGVVTLDGRKWKLQGMGMASGLKFNVLQAQRNGESVTLRVEGSSFGQKKQQDEIFDRATLEKLVRELDQGKPETIKVPTGINMPMVPKEVEIGLVLA